MALSRLRMVMRLGLLCCLAVVVIAPDAYAYVDPGSGALLWQMLVAGVVGAFFSVRRFFKRADLGKDKAADRDRINSQES
jgi:hypothetical protein